MGQRPPLPQLLRPAKVSNAVRRRVFERRVEATRLEPYEPMAYLGTDYGGWLVPDDMITSDWVCYSVGAGSDVSFDMELIARYGPRVRAFDPFSVYREMAEVEAGGDPRYSFHEIAITISDGPVEMFGRQDGERGSVSEVNLEGSERAFIRPGRSVASLMSEFGDERVELLKVDVEGSEYELVPTLDLETIGVRVFCVQVHHNRTVKQARRLFDGLRGHGLVPVGSEGTKFTFVRR